MNIVNGNENNKFNIKIKINEIILKLNSSCGSRKMQGIICENIFPRLHHSTGICLRAEYFSTYVHIKQKDIMEKIENISNSLNEKLNTIFPDGIRLGRAGKFNLIEMNIFIFLHGKQRFNI